MKNLTPEQMAQEVITITGVAASAIQVGDTMMSQRRLMAVSEGREGEGALWCVQRAVEKTSNHS